MVFPTPVSICQAVVFLLLILFGNAKYCVILVSFLLAYAFGKSSQQNNISWCCQSASCVWNLYLFFLLLFLYLSPCLGLLRIPLPYFWLKLSYFALNMQSPLSILLLITLDGSFFLFFIFCCCWGGVLVLELTWLCGILVLLLLA